MHFASPHPWPPHPVLVVEDEPALREILAEVLTEEGYLVHTAEDGLEALEVLGRISHPCVVLLDWFMPRLDGAGFLQHLEAQGGGASLTIIVSTISKEPIEHRLVKRILRKPYDMEQLLPVIEEHCARATPSARSGP